MNAEALLEEARSRGVRVEAVGDRLRLSPRRAVPDQLLAQATQLKGSLLALLQTTGPNGVEVLALGELVSQPRQSLPHPWKGRQVASSRGSGRLIWTDGLRAAVATDPKIDALVDLADVRLAGGQP